MTDEIVLNPGLYSALKRHLGDVAIVNQGEPVEYNYLVDPQSKQTRLIIISAGEQYRVSCCSCNDTRKRLYISHRWWWRDPETKQTWNHLIICHNEDCYSKYEMREGLHNRIFAGASGRNVTFAPGSIKKTSIKMAYEAPTQSLPGVIKPLKGLPPSHPALRYLQGRNLDIDEIDALYKPCYCSSSMYEFATKRLIIPSYSGSRLVGWQARHLGELDWKKKGAPPKYFTCPGMKRGLVVYNLDEAKKYRTLIIVEGTIDVWNFGPMCAGVWGSLLSSQQKHKILTACRQGNAVLLLDPEIMNPANERYAMIRQKNLLGLTGQFAQGMATIALPEGKDPGSLERGWLRQYVKEQAASQGVKVSYKLW